jgi:hypothetical protein
MKVCLSRLPIVPPLMNHEIAIGLSAMVADLDDTGGHSVSRPIAGTGIDGHP